MACVRVHLMIAGRRPTPVETIKTKRPIHPVRMMTMSVIRPMTLHARRG